MNNRHSSNPFLSDWDETLASQHQDTANVLASNDLGRQQSQSQGQPQPGPPRRSSFSQAESGCRQSPGSAAGAAGRQHLYTRNMSSFEAASLQLEQHQRQMVENGSVLGTITHKDLIAKMTADFQSAISTSDKQFGFDSEQLNFNPFDPFETIVDDDAVLPQSPGPATTAASTTTAAAATDPSDSSDGLNQRKHDSIDDDDAELVSTPVRNIKSLEPGHNELQLANEEPDHSRTTNEGDSSRAKASMFASLLASAEPAPDADDAFGSESGTRLQSLNGSTESPQIPTHVIKGSPSSDAERPVAFFDPFETVIDKDALNELNIANQAAADDEDEGTAGARLALAGTSRSIGESTSIETVVDNVADELARSGRLASSTNCDSEAFAQSAPNGNSNNNDISETEPANEPRQLEGLAATEEGPASGASDEQAEPTTSGVLRAYDASKALARPTGRRLEQHTSGVIEPRPTPQRLPKSKARGQQQQNRRKPSFQEDSSDSDDDDDRIQIVIKAKENADGEQSAERQQQRGAGLVPLLPPPPSKSSMKQARERGQVNDIPSPIMSYKSRQAAASGACENGSKKGLRSPSSSTSSTASLDNDAQSKEPAAKSARIEPQVEKGIVKEPDEESGGKPDDEREGQFVIPMRHSDLDDDDDDELGGGAGKSETPLYDDDTSYVLEEFPAKFDGPGWEMMLRYPPKKKLTSNRFWKRIFVKLTQVPLVVDSQKSKHPASESGDSSQQQTCWVLQIFDKPEDKKPMQEIPIQATYTVSEISSQLFDQFGKIFTIKLQYIFYKERVGVRQGQLARFIHTGHIGSSTTSGGHGVDPISIGAIKRMGAPIEHSPQISQIVKLGCNNYDSIKQFKDSLEDCLFRMPIHRDRALSTYKTEEVQMAVRDETYLELNQIGQITRQMARVRLFFLSFLNGTPTIEVGINDIHRQGREVVGRMDILPVMTEEWIRLEACELHSTVEADEFAKPESRLIKLCPPDGTFFELMRFRVRPPRNRELPLQVGANMTVTRTKVSINCEVMVPGCVSRKHGQIPCENIAIRIHIPECWVYFFREEKHFRMGSKKSVNRRPGKVKGIERFLGGGGTLQDVDGDEASSLIEVTSGQAKYEHHHHAVVWRAARWPKESQTAYVQNTMKIRLPLTAYDRMPGNLYEFVHVEYTMPATTVSHTTLRSISVNPCDDEPPEKYVKYSAKYEYKVKMRLSVNLGAGQQAQADKSEVSPIVIMKQPDLSDDLQKEADSDDDDDDSDGLETRDQ